MRATAQALATLVLIAAPGGQAAVAAPVAPIPAAPTPPAPTKEVSPVTVFPATAAPKIVRSFPAAGQALQAGVTVMSVTFDQPMLKTGFDFGPAPGGEAPPCLKTPRLLDDNKTFVLLCTTDPHKSYALVFNAKPEGGFANVAEHRAEPMTLAFSTTDADGPRDVKTAMKVSGLRAIDLPIENDPDRPAPKTDH
jgi:hypothetical protein